ncbi:MAG: VCBS repeat-containing protein [Myxococcales bacterium]|nr:VCBS repeat-containing protein [Myxococcales bacterium]
MALRSSLRRFSACLLGLAACAPPSGAELTESSSTSTSTSAEATSTSTSTSNASAESTSEETATSSTTGDASTTAAPSQCGDGEATPGELCLVRLDPLALGHQPADVELADLDDDGHLDVAVAAVGGALYTRYGRGDGTFDDAAGPLVPLVQPRGVAALARTQTGPLDLAAADMGFNSIALLEHEAPRSYAAPKGLPVGDQPRALARGDLDGDGDDDLVIASQGNDTVTVALFAGDAPPILQSYAVGEEPYAVTLADLDDDGALDVATADRVSGSISVLLGDGAGGFADATAHAARPDVRSLAIADLNGDGAQDIVATSFDDSKLTILRGHGDGIGFTSLFLPTGAELYGVAVGDLDHDGAVDILATDLGSSELLVIRDLQTELPTVSRMATSAGPLDVTVGDLDGDGDLDVVVAATYGDAVDVFVNDP